MAKSVVAKIKSVRTYQKDVERDGKTMKVTRRIANLQYADFDIDNPDVDVMFQRFVEDGDDEFYFYIPENVGKNILLSCSTINNGADGSWFLTVQGCGLTNKEWIAPTPTVVDEGESTMNS